MLLMLLLSAPNAIWVANKLLCYQVLYLHTGNNNVVPSATKGTYLPGMEKKVPPPAPHRIDVERALVGINSFRVHVRYTSSAGPAFTLAMLRARAWKVIRFPCLVVFKAKLAATNAHAFLIP